MGLSGSSSQQQQQWQQLRNCSSRLLGRGGVAVKAPDKVMFCVFKKHLKEKFVVPTCAQDANDTCLGHWPNKNTFTNRK